jgi:hypothetical protein
MKEDPRSLYNIYNCFTQRDYHWRPGRRMPFLPENKGANNKLMMKTLSTKLFKEIVVKVLKLLV